MRVLTIGRACLLCETEDARILTDPWLAGPSTFDAWWHVPGPLLGPDFLPEFDFLYLSRLPTDPWHIPTLRRLEKGSKVLTPALRPNHLANHLARLGFTWIAEVPHDREILLGGHTRVRCLRHGTESLLVVAEGPAPTLNANGSLSSRPPPRTLSDLNWLAAQYGYTIALQASGGAARSPKSRRLEGGEEGLDSWVEPYALTGNLPVAPRRTGPTLPGAPVGGPVLITPYLLWTN